MNTAKYICAILSLTTALANRAADEAAKWNGLYAMCEDVAGYSGEFLELKDGKFRYWFYTDVIVKDQPVPKYPLHGNFKIEGNTLTLEHEDINSKVRVLDELNGVKIVWRDDGLKLWKDDKRLHPYAVLIWTMAELKNLGEVKRPSLKVIKIKELVAKEEKEYEERYNEMPEPARGLFRDAKSRDKLEWERADKVLAELSQKPNPELFKQLVRIMATYEFNEAYYAEHFIRQMIPAKGDNSVALGMLVDAIPMANHSCIETVLVVFMKLSGTELCDLKIPETDIRIRLKVDGTGTSYSSDGLYRPRIAETRDFAPVATACQQWCREQLAKTREKQK